MQSRNRGRYFFLLPLIFLLAACDMEPVGAGQWSIQIEMSTGSEASNWIIAPTGEINVSGSAITIGDGSAVLAGSRISWSGTMPNPANPVTPLNVNFDGTVDRNSLQGTLYTTLGNWSVTGTRQ